LTPREKTNQWWAMVEGKKQILIGARSALFCPLPKLGMIVIDEEHETSFKQDEKLKYHARDAAVMLAKFSACPVVLGSATPSLESWQNAKSGRYRLHQLKHRVADRAMPTIEVIDLRGEREERKIEGTQDKFPFWCGEVLFKAIGETLEKGQQAALFLNRRGVAQAVICPDCGWVPACPNCAVKLTLHGKSHLLCHYCDYHETLTEYCTECKDGEPKPIGLGTELIERDLTRLFPGARIARMDRDEITTREDLEDAVRSIENREVDILVGTQMIAKGLDFPGLTLVGLVMADVAFNLPDFRASERAFQLLTQVAGRSGRHLDEGAGRVIIQTYNPEHPSIHYTVNHDYEGFAEYDLGFREPLHYPPFWRLASFRIQ
ncbi:MAG: primosomal protein N', partial [Proteobacteria bacterium]